MLKPDALTASLGCCRNPALPVKRRLTKGVALKTSEKAGTEQKKFLELYSLRKIKTIIGFRIAKVTTSHVRMYIGLYVVSGDTSTI